MFDLLCYNLCTRSAIKLINFLFIIESRTLKRQQLLIVCLRSKISLISRANFAALNFHRFYYYTEEIPLQNEIIKNVVNDENAPDMWEIESNADLLLINSYEILSNIRPSVPTTIYLGGIHQKLEKTPMSPSLSQFLDDSERVVYVNLNSAIQQDPIRIEKLLNALENSNVDIVWSISDDYVNTSARHYQGFDIDQESILGKFCHVLP